ncbi:MAG TPA: DNA-3-methyladenine glycosylase 2 family protein [Chitinophagaceae bacterium]|jgi:DNA-3-methyladenine glycosylase II|nr:DNA-3-methyladenine glycosylase 2 family protein [Chitinophagaceae bacterium]HMU60130.1 DNA-3-methyladenine glycosylase 2 family protein [Chitinophagaceae bacterium]
MIQQFDENNFHRFCDLLTQKDKDLRNIIRQHGYPPMWTRPNTFQTLILTILEQQVSLAAAYAAFKKLKERIGYVTPQKILQLSDEEMRACYFTRQKMGYARHLAEAIISKQISLKKLSLLPDEEVRTKMIQLKGIGHWTIDVYLMHALQRTDLFPLGDIALVNSLKENKRLHPHITKEEMLSVAEPWRPYRTIASMILWHSYIKKRNIKLQE